MVVMWRARQSLLSEIIEYPRGRKKVFLSEEVIAQFEALQLHDMLALGFEKAQAFFISRRHAR